LTDYIEGIEAKKPGFEWREWILNGLARIGNVALAVGVLFGWLGLAHYELGIPVSILFTKNSPEETYIVGGIFCGIVLMKVNLRKQVQTKRRKDDQEE
jgi:hypothetical protein